MDRVLAVSVHVVDDAGEAHCFPAGSTPPAWVVAKAANPDLWADAVGEPAPAAEAATTPAPAAQNDEGPPPKAGPGSGGDAWIAYARSKGIDVPDDAPRGDVIELVEAAETK